jgi:hypothetical protein
VDAFLDQLLHAILPIMLALVSLAGFEIRKWIRQRVDNDATEGILLRLVDAVETTVKETQQTTIKQAKRAAKDGVITREEAAKIRDDAAKRVREYLGANGVAHLEKVFDKDRLDAVIKSKIEAAVHDVKSGGSK